MKPAARKPRRRPARAGAVAELRERLAAAVEALRAIRTGEVDTVVVAGEQGSQVFTLEGAGHAYRMLIESMNEGALTLGADKTILFANECFARMVRCPLEQVIGGSLRRFLSPADRAALRPHLRQPAQAGAKVTVQLQAADGSRLPVQISLRPLAAKGSARATVGMVVTDLTEAQRSEKLLRALTHRVVQVQEAERGSVALELHDNITQLLCAAHFRSQTLAAALTRRGESLARDAVKLRDMLGEAAAEVERISRNLRPSVLGQLGLVAAVRASSTEFADRTRVAVKLVSVELSASLSAETQLALYRILQEALKNVEKHARARHVEVVLTEQDCGVHLTIKDDGVGFDAARRSTRRNGRGRLGLLAMSERATYVGGALTIKSALRAGTEIAVRVPSTGAGAR